MRRPIRWTPHTNAIDAGASRNHLAGTALDVADPVTYSITGDTLVLVLRHDGEPTEIYQCKIVATGKL